MKEISFAGDMWEILPYRVWQQLFNYYREQYCDLNRMHNLIVDYENCKKLFDIVHEVGSSCFIWGCSPKCWSTRWTFDHDFMDGSAELTATIMSCDWHCIVHVDKKTAKFKPFVPQFN